MDSTRATIPTSPSTTTLAVKFSATTDGGTFLSRQPYAKREKANKNTRRRIIKTTSRMQRHQILPSTNCKPRLPHKATTMEGLLTRPGPNYHCRLSPATQATAQVRKHLGRVPNLDPSLSSHLEYHTSITTYRRSRPWPSWDFEILYYVMLPWVEVV